MPEFAWDGRSEEAAQLVAEGELGYGEIAEKIGVDRVTLWRWRETPEFQARVDENLAEFRAHVRRRGIAVLERRVAALNDRWRRMHKIIEERSKAPEMAAVPGGTSGLIVRDVKGIGRGDDFEVVETYAFDSALARSILDAEKQAAQELGQWADESDPGGSAHMTLVQVVLGEALVKVYGDAIGDARAPAGALPG